MQGVRSLGILIRMQLKNLIDLSFLRSKRAFILKAGLALVMFAAVTAAFYAVFYIAVLLSVFSFSGGLPTTVITVLLTLLQLMGIWSCMTGLARTLYGGGDNVILLVLPVKHNLVFLSKLAVYYLFELKRNLMLTLPMFIAYGLVNGAVWFYYPWMLLCFLFVSMLPVAVGAILSIPALYIPKTVSRVPVIKYIILTAAAAALVAAAFYVVGLIPSNINLLGQWGSITKSVRDFMNTFARIFAPYHALARMTVAGPLEITGQPITAYGGIALIVLIAVCAALTALSVFTARLLFLQMTAKAGETATRQRKARRNRVHPRWLSPLSEDLLRSVRSGKAVWRSFVEFFIPAFLLFALNRVYAAMNTSLAGQSMTAAFNILVLLVTVLSTNAFLAHVYSRDGAARNLLKTRPVDFRVLLGSRLVFRAVVSTLSVIVAVALWAFVLGSSLTDAVCFGIAACSFDLAHIFWCAEIDVMHPERKEGVSNEAVATVCAIVIAVIATAFYFLISSATYAFPKLAAIAVCFLALRAFLYFERVRIYFVEK